MIGGMLLADNVLSSANGPAPSSTTWESNLEVKSILIGINHIKSVHRVCFSLFLPLLIDNYNHWSAWWLNSDDPQTLLFHFISEDVFILSFVFIIIIRDIVVIIITTHKIKPPEEVLLPALSLPGLSLRGRLNFIFMFLIITNPNNNNNNSKYHLWKKPCSQLSRCPDFLFEASCLESPPCYGQHLLLPPVQMFCKWISKIT